MENIKPPRGVQLDKSHPLNRGLVGFWLMNEGDGKKVFDLSGNGNHGTIHNMAFPPISASGWNAGRRGHALSFDGTDDYVDCGVNGFSKTAGTVELWIFPKSDMGNYDNFIGFGANSSNRFAFWYNPDSSRCNWWIAGGTGSVANSITFNQNEWYHLVGTWQSGGQMKLYINGLPVGTPANYSEFTGAISDCRIGRYLYGAQNPFNGQIDQVRIYSRALSAGEVKQLYLYPDAGFPQPCEAWLYAAAAGGLSIPVAMHNYRRLRT